MNSQQFTKLKFPDKSGVYFFKKGSKILYIGKATSLRDRVRSYFSKDIIETRGPHILDMVFKSSTVSYQETDTVLEALILEANLIKKNQPYYNTKEKDDKSWNYVCITKPVRNAVAGGEDVSKVVVVRGKELKSKSWPVLDTFGPFTSGSALREALKIIRRIFPFVDEHSVKKDQKEFYKQLGLTPESKEEYKNNIKHIRLFFKGKKKQILKKLENEMKACVKVQKFEEAGHVRNKIFALTHINDIALIKDDVVHSGSGFLNSKKIRIEAYDVAHMSGKNMVGVMTVVENGVANPSEYRKFIIRTQNGSNDTGALEEILSRRFRHTEWGMPDIVLTDGGVAQMRTAEQVLKRYQLDIPVLSLVKDGKHKAREILGDVSLVKKYKKALLLVNSEAHRFAITFHKKKRAKSFLN